MSQFVSQWLTWGVAENQNRPGEPPDFTLETRKQATSRTTKRAFRGFGRTVPARSEVSSRDNSTRAAVSLEVATVAAMLLDEFAHAGLIVQVHVSGWGRDLLFVSDDVPESKINGRPEVVYRAHDLKKLARIPLDPPHLRNVQMVKEILGGAIEDVMESDTEVGHAEEG